MSNLLQNSIFILDNTVHLFCPKNSTEFNGRYFMRLLQLLHTAPTAHLGLWRDCRSSPVKLPPLHCLCKPAHTVHDALKLGYKRPLPAHQRMVVNIEYKLCGAQIYERHQGWRFCLPCSEITAPPNEFFCEKLIGRHP